MVVKFSKIFHKKHFLKIISKNRFQLFLENFDCYSGWFTKITKTIIYSK